MNDITDLARGAINGDHELSVQLIQPDNMPAVVRITWPSAASVVPAVRFAETAATIARMFATAATTLAAIKAHRKL